MQIAKLIKKINPLDSASQNGGSAESPSEGFAVYEIPHDPGEESLEDVKSYLEEEYGKKYGMEFPSKPDSTELVEFYKTNTQEDGEPIKINYYKEDGELEVKFSRNSLSEEEIDEIVDSVNDLLENDFELKYKFGTSL